MTRRALRERCVELIDRLADGTRNDAARDLLISDVLAWQARSVPPYAKLVAAHGSAIDLPALPTEVFRFARVAAHPPELDARVFRTSGTTAAPRGAHHLRELDLYDRAAHAAARHALFPDLPRMRLVLVAPPVHEAPESSLSYMLDRFADWFGSTRSTWAVRDDRLDLSPVIGALEEATAAGEPVALLGTSFGFVHLIDGLAGRTFALRPRSRIMQTGGFKGRSRELSPQAMRALLCATFGVPEELVIAEYGMTEMSSQLYENTLRDALMGDDAGPRRICPPGWVRAVPVDPETLVHVPAGEVGVLRVDDLANLDTACAIQTADLARAVSDGVELLGRAPGATPRGCSLTMDAVLGAQS